jgi:hypothetical protein
VTKSNLPVPPDSDPSTQDNALISFLHTYRPSVPQAEPHAEETLMQAIAQPLPHPPGKIKGRLRVLVGLGILAGIGLGIGQLSRWFMPQPPVGELASLETFLVENWDSSAEPMEPLTEWNWLSQERKTVQLMSSISHLPVDLER